MRTAIPEPALHVDVVREEGSYCAHVTEWPGCFAAGNAPDELLQALEEAIALYVTPNDEQPPSLQLTVRGLDLPVESRGEFRPARQGVSGFADSPFARSRDPHRGVPSSGWYRRYDGVAV